MNYNTSLMQLGLVNGRHSVTEQTNLFVLLKYVNIIHVIL